MAKAKAASESKNITSSADSAETRNVFHSAPSRSTLLKTVWMLVSSSGPKVSFGG